MEKEFISFENYNLPIRIHQLHMREGGNYRGIHSHTSIEVVAVKSGVLHCCVNKNTVKVRAKQVIFINSNIGHRLISDNAEITYLHIDVSLLEKNMNDNKFSKLYTFISHTHSTPYLVLDDSTEITELLSKITSRYYQQSRESFWYTKAHLYELVAFMYAHSFIYSPTTPEKNLKKIEYIVDYIDENFQEHITLDDICSATKYNKYTVCHIFKEATGSTIFEYINFIRVHYAIEKLKKTENSVLEIATECGFSSATYFSRVFKGFLGCSPSTYRKLLITKCR